MDYAARFEEAERWRDQSGLVPAAADRFRIALVVVDVQNTFCTPGFELFVAGRSGTGALDDSRRLCEFVYRNLASADADRADARHTPGAPDLPPDHAHRRGGSSSRAVHDGDGRGRGGRTLADQPSRRRGPRARRRLRRGAPALLHADAGGGWQVQPHRLALPRHARRGRLRARLGGRGGALLPLDRPLGAARLPAEGRQPAHGALLDARTGGRVRPRGRAAREAKPPARRAAASVSTPS